MLVIIKYNNTTDEFDYNDDIFNLLNVIKSRLSDLPKSTKIHVTIITDKTCMDSNIYGVVEL